jgi:hypothetical protein
MIRYFIDNPSALKRYVLKFLLSSAGYPSQEVSTRESADLYYGNTPSLTYPLVIPDRPEDLISADILAEATRELADSRVPFDIVAATASLITDAVNEGRHSYDIHDRLTYADSFQSEMESANYPPSTVSAYIKHLRALLSRVAGEGIPLWPNGKIAALGLSHDVDRLDKWSEVRGTLVANRFFADAGRSLIRNVVRPHDDERLFREVIDHERSLGFQSTFMFAAINRYHPLGSGYDVAYSIDNAKIRSLMRYAQEHGCEVGLHASYNAYKDPERFQQERILLANAAGSPIIGLRHHFWHLGRKVESTLSFHEQAGFRYDSSIAWNEHTGYRRSIASPYFPWYSAEQREIGVMQLPVCVMDGNLFYIKGMTAVTAVEKLLTIVSDLEECGGLGVVDWHSDTSHPQTPSYTEWGKAYFEFLHRLSDKPRLWVTKLGEITRWLAKRQEDLSVAV